ncbi:EIIAB-Man [uncultured Clostridium sp.]|uniref:PTS sugar transporter subunit IIA n=1 Tax=uncultured Clostridium sp. TaxID=59620 RepID=UPI0008232F05|nr:PTS sugar transporter subunit IIA [uncultured Clostridium sp.]SCJ06661.1 EIIAB-Man [uncultured Clostridium sp.]
MKNMMVLMGHGHYATGIESTVRLIVGKTEGVSYIDFLEEDSSDDLMKKAVKVVEENEDSNIVFICDILGGTPFNTAVKLSLENENIRVVAGCNVSSIVETIMMKEHLEVDSLVEDLIGKTKSTVCNFKRQESLTEEILEEDGI